MNAYEVTVVEVVDHPDGTATIKFDMGAEAMKVFAAIGLQQVIFEKAKEIADGHSDAKGAGNAGAGEGSDSPISGDFPGF